jgi:ubiquitin carboxyl-terminal hydrolase L3
MAMRRTSLVCDFCSTFYALLSSTPRLITRSRSFHVPYFAVSTDERLQILVRGSPLAELLSACTPLDLEARALLLEDSKDLETAHREAALQGDSTVPENAKDEVDYHYVCFVKSKKTGQLYELDGDKKGPIDLGRIDVEEDVFGDRGIEVIRNYITDEEGGHTGFSLLALVPA